MWLAPILASGLFIAYAHVQNAFMPGDFWVYPFINPNFKGAILYYVGLLAATLVIFNLVVALHKLRDYIRRRYWSSKIDLSQV